MRPSRAFVFSSRENCPPAIATQHLMEKTRKKNPETNERRKPGFFRSFSLGVEATGRWAHGAYFYCLSLGLFSPTPITRNIFRVLEIKDNTKKEKNEKYPHRASVSFYYDTLELY